MKRQLLALSRRYQAALQKHLQQGSKSCAQPSAVRVGKEAAKLGLQTLDLARIHKAALMALAEPGDSSAARDRTATRAGAFLTDATKRIGKTHQTGKESAAHLNRQNKTLTQRTAQLTAANRHLKYGIVQRKTAEEALRKRGKHYAKLLRESLLLQRHLRHLARQLLSGQEAERKKISHELQDEVAQNLLGINVRLLALKKAARGNAASFRKEIASTQQLVEESVQSINRFAREVDIHKPA